MQCDCFLAHCYNDFCQRKPTNNPAVYMSAVSRGAEFPSAQGVANMAVGTCNDLRIVYSITRCITRILLIVSTVSFLCITIQFIHCTFINISICHLIIFFVPITHCLVQSWHKCATLLLLILFPSAPGEAEKVSTTRISIMMLPW